jgi:hypothetical protein
VCRGWGVAASGEKGANPRPFSCPHIAIKQKGPPPAGRHEATPKGGGTKRPDEIVSGAVGGPSSSPVNGLELVRLARQTTHRKRTPVIMLSAADFEREAWRAGVTAFLRKPDDAAC